MSKRYLHSAEGSRLVEDGSEEMIELLSGGRFFKDKADVEREEGTEITGEAPKEEKESEKTTAIIDLSDHDLVDLYDEVDAEMVKRGLLDVEAVTDGEVGDPIILEALNDDELKALGQKYKIPSFASMKRETLIIALRGME